MKRNLAIRNLLKGIKVLIISLVMMGCADILDVNPRQSIDATIALQSEEAIDAAINSVYARLRAVTAYGRDLIAVPELLADNADNTGAGNRLVGEATNQPGAHLSNWQVSYYAINQANLILDALERINLPTEKKQAFAGQVRFLRALFYFDLVKTYAYMPTAVIEAVNYGGVPIYTVGILSTDQIVLKPRDPIADVYQFIYGQLDQALVELENTPNSRAPHYVTKLAVKALYARVALYGGNYPKVIQMANEAITESLAAGIKFSTNATFISDWRMAVHPESIFEIVFQIPDNIGVNESLRATFTTRMDVSATVAVSHGNVVVSSALYSAYSPTDVRRQLIQFGLGNNASRYEITKFFSKNGTNNLDNVPVLRMSELYLTLAEAYAMPGPSQNENLSRSNLNIILVRAGLAEVNDTLTGQALIDEIIRQRRLELAFEGHRFFDLKRLGRDISKAATVEFQDFRILANIPNREIDANPELRQNNGY